MSGPAAQELFDDPNYSLERIADALVDIAVVLHGVLDHLRVLRASLHEEGLSVGLTSEDAARIRGEVKP